MPLHGLPVNIVKAVKAPPRPEGRGDGYHRSEDGLHRRLGRAQGGRAPASRRDALGRQHDAPRDALDGGRPQPLRAREDHEGRPLEGAGGGRRRGGLLGRRPGRRMGGLAAVRMARHRRLPHSPAPAFEHGQGALRGGRRRGRRCREPCAREGRRGARRGRLRAAPGCHRRRRGGERLGPARPRRVRGEPRVHLDAADGRDRPALLRGRGHRQGALPAAAADPERDRAAERARAAGARDGRVHDVVGDAGPAHRAGDPLRNDGDPGDQAPGHRARRRRWVRLEAQRLRGGGPVPRARTAARASDQVDGGALRGLRGDHPRARRPAGDRARGDRGGEGHRRPRPADGRDGRVHAARLARDPAPRRLALRGVLRRAGVRLRVRRRLHEHDSDRRLSRRGPPGGDVCDRAGDGLARAQAGHGSGRAPAQELHRRVSQGDRVRARDRLRRLPRLARQGARARRLRRVPSRPGRAARTRRPEADRHRPVDLRRDVRPRPVAHPRRDPLRRRRLGRRHDPLPADRDRPGPDRHLAARAGARRRRSRRSSPTGSGSRSRTSRCSTATPR